MILHLITIKAFENYPLVQLKLNSNYQVINLLTDQLAEYDFVALTYNEAISAYTCIIILLTFSFLSLSSI